jgi:hypothetical protein
MSSLTDCTYNSVELQQTEQPKIVIQETLQQKKPEQAQEQDLDKDYSLSAEKKHSETWDEYFERTMTPLQFTTYKIQLISEDNESVRHTYRQLFRRPKQVTNVDEYKQRCLQGDVIPIRTKQNSYYYDNAYEEKEGARIENLP